MPMPNINEVLVNVSMSLRGIRTEGVAFKCSFMSSAANTAAFPSHSSLCSPRALGLYLYIIPTQRASENALSASCKCNSWQGCIRLWLCQELDRFVAAGERGNVGKHIGTHHSSVLQLEEKMTEKGLQTWSDISKEKVWKHQRFIHPVKNQHEKFICNTACSYVTRECCLLSGLKMDFCIRVSLYALAYARLCLTDEETMRVMEKTYLFLLLPLEASQISLGFTSEGFPSCVAEPCGKTSNACVHMW